jgi:hypothetical protein
MSNAISRSPITLPKIPFPGPLKRRNQAFSRRHSRYDCVVVGVMRVIEIGAGFDGALIEVSRGGCTFRQASMFVLDRIGETVSIYTEFFEVEGRIRSVRPEGYGVQFFSDVDDAVINRIVTEYGFKIADSFLAKRN